MANAKVKEIETALGIELKGGVYDLELFEEEWNAFFQNPLSYVGTVVIDMVNLWYSKIHPQPEFVDAYYLEYDLMRR